MEDRISMLWDTLNTNNFYFILFYFSDFIWTFYFSFLFLLNDGEVCDMKVT